MLDVLAFVQSNLLCRCQLRHLLNQGLELMVQWKVFAVHCKLTRNLACYRTWGNHASYIFQTREEIIHFRWTSQRFKWRWIKIINTINVQNSLSLCTPSASYNLGEEEECAWVKQSAVNTTWLGVWWETSVQNTCRYSGHYGWHVWLRASTVGQKLRVKGCLAWSREKGRKCN